MESISHRHLILRGAAARMGGAVLWLVLLCGMLQPWIAAAAPKAKFRPGSILIQPRDGVEADLDHLRERHGHKLRHKYKNFGGLEAVRLPPGSKVEDALALYQQSGLVEFAEPDYIWQASLAPNDPAFTNGLVWGLHNTGQSNGKADGDIDAPEAWEGRASSEDVIVAVIDSGIRYTHEDLAANMWRNSREIANGLDDDNNGLVDDIHGINASDFNGDPMDEIGHGTHVAGTIGAVANNGKGLAGVSWNVQLMACKFMGLDGGGSTSDAILCMDYARAYGAKVINASWGSSSYSYALTRAISKLRAAGIIFVAAAGNERLNNDFYPSYPANIRSDNLLSVTATTAADILDPSYANYGAASVHLAAPGSNIYSTWHTADNAYTSMSGTSMAAPHVTGAIALLIAQYPAESHAQIIQRLLNGTDPLPSLKGTCISGGRLNLKNALGIAPTRAPLSLAPFQITALELDAASDIVKMRFEAEPGQKYRVLQARALAAGWFPVAEVTATERWCEVQVNAPEGVVFFKVEATGTQS